MAKAGDGSIVIAITRGELRAMLGKELSDEDIERLQDAIPHSSVPEALATIASHMLGQDGEEPQPPLREYEVDLILTASRGVTVRARDEHLAHGLAMSQAESITYVTPCWSDGQPMGEDIWHVDGELECEITGDRIVDEDKED